MPVTRHRPSVISFAFRIGSGGLFVLLSGAAGVADLAPASRLPPQIAAIDTACNAQRTQARPAGIYHLVRLPDAGGSPGAWQLATPATAANLESAATFTSGDFLTLVTDRGALVVAELVHDDAAAHTVLAHAWCFIGGRLSRATADLSTIGGAGSGGYRRTRYYGDDLDPPLAETMLQKGTRQSKYEPPPHDVDAALDTEPVARPSDLPFYDAFVAARDGRLAHVK